MSKRLRLRNVEPRTLLSGRETTDDERLLAAWRDVPTSEVRRKIARLERLLALRGKEPSPSKEENNG